MQYLNGDWDRSNIISDSNEHLGPACYVPPKSYEKLEMKIKEGNLSSQTLIQLIQDNRNKIGTRPEGRIIWISYRDEQFILRKSAPISEIQNLDKGGEQVLL